MSPSANMPENAATPRGPGSATSDVTTSAERQLVAPVESAPLHTDGAATPKSWLWLTEHDQLFVAAFVAVFLVLAGINWLKLGGWGSVPLEIQRLPVRKYDFRIDINSASWVEWSQIEGIGAATARKIVADREAKGPFRDLSDLLRVKGIGPKTFGKIKPFLRDGAADQRSSDSSDSPVVER